MTRPRLAVVHPDATPEEVAAILAAVTVTLEAVAPEPEAPSRGAGNWVQASRMHSRRAGLQRGDWRLAGRMPPR